MSQNEIAISVQGLKKSYQYVTVLTGVCKMPGLFVPLPESARDLHRKYHSCAVFLAACR